PADAADAAAQPGFAAGQLSSWPWSPDSPVTDAFPAVSSGENAGWSTSPAETARRHDSQGAGQAGLTDEMRTGPAAGADPGGQGADVSREPAGPAGPDHRGPATSADREPAGPAGRRNARRRWPVMAVGAFGVFVFALGGITAFEVAAGKPLDALIWGRNSGGTTVGDITRVQRAEPALRTRPHRAAPSPAHRTTGQPTPTPSPSSPTPTATRSPSPSPSPARSSPAAATPSPSGSA
ncbi:MAG TPA: hypothetical protein VK162_07095, partial [Streptosporangiaceae bacterium]|nr:hypothetical protein [Streptosporangiaceae bacterium]